MFNKPMFCWFRVIDADGNEYRTKGGSTSVGAGI